jgi:hypothetical protein
MWVNQSMRMYDRGQKFLEEEKAAEAEAAEAAWKHDLPVLVKTNAKTKQFAKAIGMLRTEKALVATVDALNESFADLETAREELLSSFQTPLTAPTAELFENGLRLLADPANTGDKTKHAVVLQLANDLQERWHDREQRIETLGATLKNISQLYAKLKKSQCMAAAEKCCTLLYINSRPYAVAATAHDEPYAVAATATAHDDGQIAVELAFDDDENAVVDVKLKNGRNTMYPMDRMYRSGIVDYLQTTIPEIEVIDGAGAEIGIYCVYEAKGVTRGTYDRKSPALLSFCRNHPIVFILHLAARAPTDLDFNVSAVSSPDLNKYHTMLQVTAMKQAIDLERNTACAVYMRTVLGLDED